MSAKNLYALLCLPGFCLPLIPFTPWLLQHGPDIPLLFAELFATRSGAFFALDVLVSACVLLVFMLIEGRRLGVRRLWLPLVSTVLIGVSAGLPLFLALRAAQLEKAESSGR